MSVAYSWISFEEWYRRGRPRLIAALAVASGELDVAVDAVDEAMVRALQRWDRVQTMESPDGWVYRVGLNLVRRKMRRRGLERRLLIRAKAVDPPGLRTEVWEAVRALPPRQREAVALRYLLGFSEAEVARQMQVAEGTASATLAAARTRLAVLLADDEVTGVDGR
jgi:RNA polymerase sigma-70 factor, ECF subfamily